MFREKIIKYTQIYIQPYKKLGKKGNRELYQRTF